MPFINVKNISKIYNMGEVSIKAIEKLVFLLKRVNW